jgi:hypothetical protein
MTFFITGTDTDAGKTFVTALLTRSLRKAGFDTVAMKPISCGEPRDTGALREAADNELSIEEVTPVAYKAPLAPIEAARLEGAKSWQILLRVYLPMAAPGIAATAILNTIRIWNELAIALGLTFDKAQTVTLAVAAYRGYASIDWGALSAAAITSMLPMLIFAVLAQRQIVGGLSLGAVK